MARIINLRKENRQQPSKTSTWLQSFSFVKVCSYLCCFLLGRISTVFDDVDDLHRPLSSLQEMEGLQFRVQMLEARTKTLIYGPMDLLQLSDTDRAEYQAFEMTFEHKESCFSDSRGGISSKTQVPPQAVEHMTRIENAWAKEWSETLVTILVTAVLKGEDISPPDYPGSALQVQMALTDTAIPYFKSKQRNPKVLVGGSISPWVESVTLATLQHDNLLLQNGKVYVADWQPITVHDKRIENIMMPDLTKHRPNELFDVIISYSSIEHDGLGRYGDPLNPAGDFAAMAEFYTLLKPDGILLLGLPYKGDQRGRINCNYQRVYNDVRMTQMQLGYTKLNQVNATSEELAQRYHVQINPGINVGGWQCQPVIVLQKNPKELPWALS